MGDTELNIREPLNDKIIPSQWVLGTRQYLERLVHQINGAYEFGFFDACAVLCRRLMESLIIETYISQKRHQEIQNNGTFLGLENLITKIENDTSIPLSRSAPKTMKLVKEIGDIAAHDRTYITRGEDIDDIKLKFRRLINELLSYTTIKKSN